MSFPPKEGDVDAMTAPLIEEADDLTERLLATTNDPVRFVELAFPNIRLEKWQRRVLQTIADQLQENTRLDRWKAVQIAVASGNGVGETGLLSFILLWGLMTFEDTIGVCTAGTEPQIRTRLWGSYRSGTLNCLRRCGPSSR
jgi:hypothetical protein